MLKLKLNNPTLSPTLKLHPIPMPRRRLISRPTTKIRFENGTVNS
jgi:hypothetical protein